MTRLQRLFADHGQSPWLDNLTRGSLRDGGLAALVDNGIRGVTANPTTFARAIGGSPDYDEQFSALLALGCSVEDAYWQLVVADVIDALAVLRPLYDSTNGADGFVSVEVAPELAHDTAATVAAARGLHAWIDQPNLLVKIPATAEGIPAIHAMIAQGHSINVTLIFSLARYAQVVDAYLSGLEDLTAAGGDPSTVHSVASFFVGRVDAEVDSRLEWNRDDAAQALRGRAGVAQAKLAYQLFREQFAGTRWDRLAARGAQVQRPLWASTSPKNPALPDTLYVDSLIGPDTVTTLPEVTIAAYEDHGTSAASLELGVHEAGGTMRGLAAAGIDMDDVGIALENRGIEGFLTSSQGVLAALRDKADNLVRR